MEVPNLLTSVGAAVEDEPVTIRKVFGLGYLSRHDKKVANECGVIRLNKVISRYGFTWNDQDMHRSRRSYVSNRETFVVSMHKIPRDLTFLDHLEERFVGHG